MGLVEVAFAVLFLVLDDQQGTGIAEEFDGVEPVVEVSVFGAGVVYEGIDGAFGEEELMGLVVDFLSAEVPDVDAEGAIVFQGEEELNDVDAFSGLFGGESVVLILELFR